MSAKKVTKENKNNNESVETVDYALENGTIVQVAPCGLWGQVYAVPTEKGERYSFVIFNDGNVAYDPGKTWGEHATAQTLSILEKRIMQLKATKAAISEAHPADEPAS